MIDLKYFQALMLTCACVGHVHVAVSVCAFIIFSLCIVHGMCNFTVASIYCTT